MYTIEISHLSRLSLLLIYTIKNQNLNEFREVVRSIACSVSDTEAKTLFKNVRSDLREGDIVWMERAIVLIQSGVEE